MSEFKDYVTEKEDNVATTVEFKTYRRKARTTELRPVEAGETYDRLMMEDVSISPEDRRNGSPKKGDMVARDPDNPDDQWLMSAEYFKKNFEPEPI